MYSHESMSDPEESEESCDAAKDEQNAINKGGQAEPKMKLLKNASKRCMELERFQTHLMLGRLYEKFNPLIRHYKA